MAQQATTANANGPIYGEFAGATNGDFDNSYNLKVGAKYKF